VARHLRGGGIVALTDDQARGGIERLSQVLLRVGESRLIERRPWPRWKVRAHFPFKEVILHGRPGVPDFESRTKRTFEILRLSGG